MKLIDNEDTETILTDKTLKILQYATGATIGDIYTELLSYVPQGYEVGCFGNYGTSDSDHNRALAIIDARTSGKIILRNVNEYAHLTLTEGSTDTLSSALNIGFIPIN